MNSPGHPASRRRTIVVVARDPQGQSRFSFPFEQRVDATNALTRGKPSVVAVRPTVVYLPPPPPALLSAYIDMQASQSSLGLTHRPSSSSLRQVNAFTPPQQLAKVSLAARVNPSGNGAATSIKTAKVVGTGGTAYEEMAKVRLMATHGFNADSWRVVGLMHLARATTARPAAPSRSRLCPGWGRDLGPDKRIAVPFR